MLPAARLSLLRMCKANRPSKGHRYYRKIANQRQQVGKDLLPFFNLHLLQSN
jgi:hypothetical protein